jgi:nucleotide-binding universal stress UspA family protein
MPEAVMFRSILVPVDGTIMAEQAAMPAAEIAKRLGARLSLAVVHPSGPMEDAPVSGSARDRELRRREVAYLERLRDRLLDAFGIEAACRVLEGDPAPALATVAEEVGVDLVVTSTRGRGALLRACQGDLALRLAHAVPCPTLFLKPRGRDQVAVPPAGFQRIVVALDGSRLAEASLEPALALADPSRAHLTLAQVVHPGGAGLAERRADALAYLREMAQGLQNRCMAVDVRVLPRVDPARALVDHARRVQAELLALTTRDRGAARRIVLGSMADAVVHRGFVPTLVCHSLATRGAPRRPARTRLPAAVR